MNKDENPQAYNAWNPGIVTPIPVQYEHLATIMRPENVFNTPEEIKELANFMSAEPHEVVRCRPERLILHETMLRMMCDVKIPEGEDYTGLGTNFRAMTRTVLDRYVMPHMDELNAAYDEMRRSVDGRIGDILDKTLYARPEVAATPSDKGLSGWFNFFRRDDKGKKSNKTVSDPYVENNRHLEYFKDMYQTTEDPLERSIYKNLHKVVSHLAVQYGRLGSCRDVIASLASARVCNEYGSQILGEKIEPYIAQGLQTENYPVLTPTDSPFIVALKGASASGKSSLRMAINTDPSQYLGEDTANDIDNCAVISPDVCRKMLLDYSSLGEAYKYAGTLTAQELAVIDRKIDRYIRNKMQATGQVNNMIIDRFRFDTFSVMDFDDSITFFQKAKKLSMLFVVTAPENLVERGWIRGLETGRYRATEDFLALGKEAYNGMPAKFFQWVEERDSDFDYQFLNNNVPKGEPFLEAGFGTGGHLTIVDIETFVNINRYAKVDIRASKPETLYNEDMFHDMEGNTRFLKRCVDEIPVVDFVNAQTMRSYARTLRDGPPEITDMDTFLHEIENPLSRKVFSELGFLKLPDVQAALREYPAPPMA